MILLTDSRFKFINNYANECAQISTVLYWRNFLIVIILNAAAFTIAAIPIAFFLKKSFDIERHLMATGRYNVSVLRWEVRKRPEEKKR